MTQTTGIAFSIDRNAAIPVFEQICIAIRERVAEGALRAGTRLPPTRAFATELGVSRSTVVTAYDQLVAEGYLDSVQGSGHTVRAMSAVELQRHGKPATALSPLETRPALPRPFEAGQPDMRLFPHAQWAKTVSRVCRTAPESMLIGRARIGNLALREAIADHLAEWRGIEASPHQIIVTAGSIDALELCLRCLTRPGDAIGLEDPGYQALRSFVSDLGLDTVDLKVDAAGSALPPAESNARLVVLTPSHQYPLGGAMAPQRRIDFLNWAMDRNAWVIEDDYDSEFRFSGRPIPAMAGFDRLNRTIYVGSFSKIFSNNLRLGYVVVPAQLREQFAATLGRFGFKASYMPQQPLAEFMNSGGFYRHLRRMRRIYGERRKFLTQRLTEEFSTFGRFDDHQAGMQIAFHLKDGIDDRSVVKVAAARGLTLHALSGFCRNGTDYNGLLLGYCGFDQTELDQALNELKAVLQDSTDRIA